MIVTKGGSQLRMDKSNLTAGHATEDIIPIHFALHQASSINNCVLGQDNLLPQGASISN